MVENVFVLGLDAHNADILHRLPDAARYRFHPLLCVDELLYGDIDPPARALLEAAQRQLESFDGRSMRHRILGLPGQHHGADPLPAARAFAGPASSPS